MSVFTIDPQKCARDGICVSECPMMILRLGEKSAEPIAGAEDICIRCGHCVAVCQHGAFALDGMGPEDCPPLIRSKIPSPADAEHFLRTRRSIRSYKKEAVDKETIENLIKIARYGPTGTNSQKVGWLVIHSPEEVRRLSGLAVDWMRYVVKKGHPMAEQYRLSGIVQAWDGGLDIICRGAPHLVIAHAPDEYAAGQADCTIALTYLDLAAPSFGLGTCWAGFFMIAASVWPALKEAIGLPKGQRLYGAMMLGHPKYKYQRLPLRKEPEITWRESPKEGFR